jgi:hypothetical protein
LTVLTQLFIHFAEVSETEGYAPVYPFFLHKQIIVNLCQGASTSSQYE